MRKYLPLYYDWIEMDKLPGRNGLCQVLPGEALDLFWPTPENLDQLRGSGLCDVYWASELPLLETEQVCGETFNPLRQNIVLLLAALNGEL